MPRARIALLLPLALGAAGCVTRADFDKVRRTQQDMRALLADTQVSVDKLNRRLDTLESGAAESAGGRTAAAMRTLERRLSNVETRLSLLEAGAVRPSEPTPSIGHEGVGPSPTPAGAALGGPAQRTEAAAIALRREEARLRGGGVNETYRTALQLYREGQAGKAIEQFRQFVRSSPKSDLADNAQYWIGEAYYSSKDYNRAIIELNEVLLKYPQGDQVAGALLALATAFAESGDKIDARLILQKLISDHPQSEEAAVGRKQLQGLTE